MHLSPDEIIFWQHGFLKLNATIVFTWGLMLVLAAGSKLITSNLSMDLKRSPWQNLLEIVVIGIKNQIEEVGLRQPERYLGFLGTLFLFVALASICTILPGFEPPTASLSTTTALALCVWRCRFSASRSRGRGATSSLTSSQRSLCCRLTSSVNFHERWLWPFAYLAT